MTIDDSELEKASLLPDRWYIILRKMDDETFSVSAYDTTTEDDEEFYEAGTVVINGVMELMESDFDVVTAAGLARLAHSHVKEALEEVTGKREVTREEGTNVIKVNFGKVQ
tara:strand:+ start:204 stop:536 length:333 start_codon:yes stop_codon:yes gene_type:complete